MNKEERFKKFVKEHPNFFLSKHSPAIRKGFKKIIYKKKNNLKTYLILMRFNKQIAVSKWRKNNPLKVMAHRKVFNAIRNGTLKRKSCKICGMKAHAHHEDYSNPLKIEWLCPTHHGKRHNNLQKLLKNITKINYIHKHQNLIL